MRRERKQMDRQIDKTNYKKETLSQAGGAHALRLLPKHSVTMTMQCWWEEDSQATLFKNSEIMALNL